MSEPTTMGVLVDVATSSLTLPQLRCFLRGVVVGEPEHAIADLYGCTQPNVNKTKSVALQRMRQAINKDPLIMTALTLQSPLVDDKELVDVIAKLRAAPTGKDVRSLLKGCLPNPSTVAALAVLAVLDALADDERCVTYALAHQHIHSAVVAGAVPVLRSQGFVMSDGQTIRINRMPS